MVWGWEWKILFLLGLKIVYGNRVKNLTHQAGGLGTENKARCPRRRARRFDEGPQEGPWACPWFP